MKKLILLVLILSLLGFVTACRDEVEDEIDNDIIGEETSQDEIEIDEIEIEEPEDDFEDMEDDFEEPEDDDLEDIEDEFEDEF